MNVVIKPLILKTLRTNKRIPLNAVAQKLKLPEDDYEKYEKHEFEVSLEEAEKIAKIFKRNWTVFLLDNPPSKPDFKQDNRSTNLIQSGIGQKTYEALEESNYLLNFILEISDSTENKIPKADEDIPATALASEFRKVIGTPIDKQPKFRSAGEALSYWISAVGKLGINVSRFPLGENDGVRAFSIHKKNKAVIVINSEDSDNGKLFSLFHELAHVIRRNTGVCDMHRDENVESYCNSFASELLIPTKLYEQLTDGLEINNETAYEIAGDISKQIKISRIAVLTRFMRSGKITKPQYDEFYRKELAYYDMYKKQQDEKRKASKGKQIVNPYALKRSRLGKLFTNEIFDALHQARITPFEASNYLGFKVKTIRSFNEWVGQHEGS